MSETREDTRAALLALFASHMPEIRWDNDERAAYIVCSCGNGVYVGHLTTLIVNRLHGEVLADWEREFLATQVRHLHAAHPTPTPATTRAGTNGGAADD